MTRITKWNFNYPLALGCGAQKANAEKKKAPANSYLPPGLSDFAIAVPTVRLRTLKGVEIKRGH
jgi:hypothetical protein